MSEKKKLFNVGVSFIIGTIFFFGTIYLEDFLSRQNFSVNRYHQYGPSIGSQILIFIFIAAFFSSIVSFIYKYLISDVFKIKIILNLEALFKKK